MMTRRDARFNVSMLFGGVKALDEWQAIPVVDRTASARATGFSPDEPVCWEQPDKSIVGVFRDNGGSSRLFRAVSTDLGRTWSTPEKTNYPNSTSKLCPLHTSRGYHVLVSNANVTLGRRELHLAISEDGWTFTRMGRLDIPSPKPATLQYPHVIEHDGNLFIAFSRNKAISEVFKLSLDEVDRLRTRKIRSCDVAPRSAPDHGHAALHGTVIHDGGKFRMWYLGMLQTEFKHGQAPDYWRPMCYAESADGIHWTKPELGLVDFNGNRRNNICLIEGDPFSLTRVDDFLSVLHDPADPDPARRYKAAYIAHVPYDEIRGGMSKVGTKERIVCSTICATSADRQRKRSCRGGGRASEVSALGASVLETRASNAPQPTQDEDRGGSSKVRGGSVGLAIRSASSAKARSRGPASRCGPRRCGHRPSMP